MPSKYQPSGTGYNGVTGAKATFNEGTGMWTDTAGQQIRDDAITGAPSSGAPPQAAGQAAATGSASTIQDTGMSTGGGGGGGGSALSGLQSAMPMSTETPTAINPLLLGQRIPPSSQAILSGLRNIY